VVVVVYKHDEKKMTFLDTGVKKTPQISSDQRVRQ
jgi:hypothetical protein